MKKLLGVGKFTTHPSWRNNDIFLEKVGFEEIFQQINYKDISELLFFDTIPSLKLSFNPHQAAVSESLNRQVLPTPTWYSEGGKYNSKSLF